MIHLSAILIQASVPSEMSQDIEKTARRHIAGDSNVHSRNLALALKSVGKMFGWSEEEMNFY